jgi:hypothetical protein
VTRAGEKEEDRAPAPRHRGNRWGRSEEARQAVLEAADELLGPIYYRALVTGEPVDRQFTDRLVDHHLRHLAL